MEIKRQFVFYLQTSSFYIEHLELVLLLKVRGNLQVFAYADTYG